MAERTATAEKPKLTLEQRSKRFKKIVRNHNNATGFSFVLDKLNEEPGYEYAHATHTGGNYKITCQMDVDSEGLYALSLSLALVGHSAYIDIDDSLTHAELDRIMSSEAFEKRTGALKSLVNLRTVLNDEVDSLINNIITDSITETEKQDAYDTITLAARKLLRP